MEELMGYTYGPAKDHLRLTHPCLTHWDNLSREVQAYDFLALETLFTMMRNDTSFLTRIDNPTDATA